MQQKKLVRKKRKKLVIQKRFYINILLIVSLFSVITYAKHFSGTQSPGAEAEGGLGEIVVSESSDSKISELKINDPNAQYNDVLVLTNKNNSLPKEYVPSDLVVPNVMFAAPEGHQKTHMRYEASLALEKLFNAASVEKIYLHGISAYRSYDRQDEIFNSQVKRNGKDYATKYVALPGQSEHQTGLAIDVSASSVGNALKESFENTKEGKWLHQNAHLYGYILRYPKGKQDITGYNYEPWHIRYVGEDVAKSIYDKNLTLEEYLTQSSSNN